MILIDDNYLNNWIKPKKIIKRALNKGNRKKDLTIL